MSLSREQILAARAKRKPVALEVPEWGGEVYIRVLSAKDQAELSEGMKPAEMPVKLLLHTIVDEAGERVLLDEDYDAMMGEDFPVIMRVFAEAAKLNGLSTKELEEAMASFATAPAEDRSSE